MIGAPIPTKNGLKKIATHTITKSSFTRTTSTEKQALINLNADRSAFINDPAANLFIITAFVKNPGGYYSYFGGVPVFIIDRIALTETTQTRGMKALEQFGNFNVSIGFDSIQETGWSLWMTLYVGKTTAQMDDTPDNFELTFNVYSL